MDGGRGNRAGGRGIRVESALKQNNKKIKKGNERKQKKKSVKKLPEVKALSMEWRCPLREIEVNTVRVSVEPFKHWAEWEIFMFLVKETKQSRS